ncbi:putative holin-like toxin [Virgibacillus sp. MSJ-26]
MSEVQILLTTGIFIVALIGLLLDIVDKINKK